MNLHLTPRTNDALQVNPPAGDAHITTHASDWLWAVFAIMLLSFLVVSAWTFSAREHRRIMHFVPLIVLAVASVQYFSMASDLGFTIVRTELNGHITRQIFFVRYIAWFIAAPLILLSILAFTTLATPTILTVLFFSWFLVINGLVGALVPSSYKWGYYAFGLSALFGIWILLLGHVNVRKAFAHETLKTGYLASAAYISFIWLLYPICWALSEGSNTISPTSEMVFYGILDIMSGPVFLISYLVFLNSVGDEELRTTAFGTAARGEQAPQMAAVQQPVAPKPGGPGGVQAPGTNGGGQNA